MTATAWDLAARRALRTTRLKRSPAGFERISKRSPHSAAYRSPIRRWPKGCCSHPRTPFIRSRRHWSSSWQRTRRPTAPFISAMVISKARSGLPASGLLRLRGSVRTLRAKGFLMVSALPLTRSSYHAGEDFARLRAAREALLLPAQGDPQLSISRRGFTA